jgi:hypothetical protein
MPKKEHPEFGTVNERTFPAAALDGRLRATLEDFKKRGLIRGYRIEDEALTLWRPWIEGPTQDEFFRGLTGGDRSNFSRQLFRRAERKLNENSYGHGALHPRNIILRQSGGFELVDAMFNRLLLNPLAVSRDDLWLWGPCVPKGWTLKDWDRVSLLRTAAILAQSPSTWEKPIPTEQATEMCRKWAEELIRSANPTDDFIPVVREAVALLPTIVDAVFEPPVFPLEEELEALVTRQGHDRMLRRRDEVRLADLAAKYGLGSDQLDRLLRVWMLLHGYQQETELQFLAAELLKAGRYGETQLVSARACAAAERAFTHYGVDSKEAEGFVQQLLFQAAWLDERQAAEKCRKFLAGHLESVSDAPNEATADDLAEDFAEESKFPPDVARRLVDLEIERRLLGLTR